MRKIPKASTVYPKALPSSLILSIVLMQKVIAGAPIRNIDKSIDAASGPKTNLPPQ